MTTPRMVTMTGPVNIAVLKYWGKADVALNTPTNPSLSVTLDQADLRTTTTVVADTAFERDIIYLNGKEDEVEKGRLQSCLVYMRKMAQVSSADKEFWAKAKFIIVTENNFPTAAGLASSASGFATLVAALAQLMGVKEAFPGELTTVARQGSGSACRSLYGGFVRWDAGGKVPDWSDSKAVQVFPESHWPDMTAAILVVNAGKKAVGSTAGMQETTRTSKLFRSRPEVAQEHLELLERAIKEKNFALFGEITMRDSNQFHAVCLDTYPPIFYMDDTSRRIVRMVHAFNEAKGAVVAAYTFDAGPNAVIYSTKATEPELLRWILYFFPPAHGQALEDYCAKPALLATAGVHSQKDIDSLQQPAGHAADREVGKISKLILTKPGPGPLLQPQEASLYDPATKGPKKQN